MRKRTRAVPLTSQTIGQVWYKYYWEPTWKPSSVYTNNSPGVAQAPFSTRELCFDEIHPGPPYETGGPFEKWTVEPHFSYPQSPGIYAGVNGNSRYEYRGSFCCNLTANDKGSWFDYTSGGVYLDLPTTVVTAPFTNSWGDFSSYGPKAWKKYQPGQSIADAAVFIGELSDVPRMLKTTAKWFSREYISRFGRNPRGSVKILADNWLNTQFGWLPFVSDLRKFYRAWKTADDVYKQIVRDNGQWIKRVGTVMEDRSETVMAEVTNGNYHYPLLASYYYPSYPQRGNGKVVRIKEDRAWFAARYRYYVPDIGSVVFKRKAIAHLYGLDLNPAVLWELIPWSWLVDWFTNFGDVLRNSSTGLLSNLAAKYAYLMWTRDVLCTAHSYAALSPPSSTSWTIRVCRKSRKAANPFGFDVSYGNLTARQWSILGALGISRMH